MSANIVSINSISSIFDSPRRQYFSLPFGIINFITQNPCSALGLQKLQKTCKYFFAKNKIIVTDKFIYQEDAYLKTTSHFKWLYLNNVNFEFPSVKYWLNFDFIMNNEASMSLSKSIYRCSLKHLTLRNQNLSFKQINFLLDGGKITRLLFNNVNIRDDHGEIVSCDKILKYVPNIRNFDYDCENDIFNTQTFEKMNSLNFKSKFKSFALRISNLSADVDFLFLLKFISNNGSRATHFGFQLKKEYCELLVSSIDIMLQNLETQNWPIFSYFIEN